VVLKRAKDSNDNDAGEVPDAPVGRAAPPAPADGPAVVVGDPVAPNSGAAAAQSQIRRR